jgi:transcriptional regulator with XRE-family HTH domain
MDRITLKAARVNAGLTQGKAAAELGISNKTLSAWENGTRVPDISMIEPICKLYGRTYDSIIFLPNNPL